MISFSLSYTFKAYRAGTPSERRCACLFSPDHLQVHRQRLATRLGRLCEFIRHKLMLLCFIHPGSVILEGGAPPDSVDDEDEDTATVTVSAFHMIPEH